MLYVIVEKILIPTGGVAAPLHKHFGFRIQLNSLAHDATGQQGGLACEHS